MLKVKLVNGVFLLSDVLDQFGTWLSEKLLAKEFADAEAQVMAENQKRWEKEAQVFEEPEWGGKYVLLPHDHPVLIEKEKQSWKRLNKDGSLTKLFHKIADEIRPD